MSNQQELLSNEDNDAIMPFPEEISFFRETGQSHSFHRLTFWRKEADDGLLQ